MKYRQQKKNADCNYLLQNSPDIKYSLKTKKKKKIQADTIAVKSNNLLRKFLLAQLHFCRQRKISCDLFFPFEANIFSDSK